MYSHDLLKFVLFYVTFFGEMVQVILFSFSEAPEYIRRSSYRSLEKVSGTANSCTITLSFSTLLNTP